MKVMAQYSLLACVALQYPGNTKVNILFISLSKLITIIKLYIKSVKTKERSRCHG